MNDPIGEESPRFILPDMTPSERTAIVAYLLGDGAALSPADVMRLTDCAERTAYDVLDRLTRVLPLYHDAGRWQLLRE